MKRIALVVLFIVAFAATANAQDLDYLMAGPRAEYMFRRAYAPVDFAIGQAGQYAGYGQHGRTAAIAAGATIGMAVGAGFGAAIGHDTKTALIGAGVGAGVGGLATYAITRHRDQPTYTTPDGRQVLVASGSQRPPDCRKPPGKRGKNEAVCAAVEQETIARQQAAEQQACLANLAASPWRLRNGSDRFSAYPTLNGQPLMVCGEQVILRPLQTIHIPQPTGQVSGQMRGAGMSGEATEFDAVVCPTNQPGFVGFILVAPGAPKGGR